MMKPSWAVRLPVIVIVSAASVLGHEHHMDDIPEGEVISPEPLDSILWWHIFSMIFAFGIVFPAGMVLGIVRSRWHVPTQVVGTVIAVMGWFLGHAHRGRQFAPNIHSAFAPLLISMLATQVGLGIYLKLHLERGFHGRIRGKIVLLHGIAGKAMPVASWVQMLFGGITALGFCHADHTGQCIAHFIMGSSFIGYGIVMCIMLLVGQPWLRRKGKSQEFWDSLCIAVWGCVNTFTEHRWGQAWEHNDIQHTSMGVIWWAAGLLGLWLSRGGKRNVIPGLVILLTGYAMSAHPQHLPLSTMIHTVFGYTLMAAGLARIIEVCFVLSDKPTLDEPHSFQHLAPFLLFASGVIFMCANEEQLALISSIGIDHVSYLLILYSLAFLIYLFTQFLLYLFMSNQKPAETANRMPRIEREAPDTLAQEADQFELEGLITDDEDGSVDGTKRRQ